MVSNIIPIQNIAIVFNIICYYFLYYRFKIPSNYSSSSKKITENDIRQIVDKYVEMNIAHPFMEGNGRATRIWLDFIFVKELRKCIDWSKIDKKDYFDAMIQSPNSDVKIKTVLKNALTSDIDNRELFMKGIDASYYYEEIE